MSFLNVFLVIRQSHVVCLSWALISILKYSIRFSYCDFYFRGFVCRFGRVILCKFQQHRQVLKNPFNALNYTMYRILQSVCQVM